MSARRWAKFWWQDWQRDPALRMCSLAARGAWIEMLCLMADADPVGHLLVNGRSPNMRQLSAVLGCSEREATRLVTELEENGVFSRSEDGTIYSRRMVRDKAISDEAAANGKKGGNPNITGKARRKVKGEDEGGLTPSLKANATPPLKHQEAEAEAERTLTSFVPPAEPSPSEVKPVEAVAENLPARPSPPDARTALFQLGLQAVRGLTGKSEGQSRSLIGKWLKACGDDASILNRILLEAADLRPAEPVAWIEAAVGQHSGRSPREAERTRNKAAWLEGEMLEGF